MIISHKHEFAFIHIPKCAGTSIRTQILKSDPEATALGKLGTHPELGSIDYGHIALDLLRAHFPEHDRDVRRYQSFAVVRDPLERFGSALRQVLWQYEERPMTLIPPEELREKTVEMLDKIAAEIDRPSAPFIFFARQESFIFDQGEQVVDHLIPVPFVADFIGYMAQRTGTQMDTGMRANQNVDLRFKGLGKMAYRVNGVLRKSLPLGLHTFIRKAALNVLASKKDAASASGVLDLPEVKAFVDTHYARDQQIYRAVMARGDALKAALAAGDLTGVTQDVPAVA